MTLVENCVRGSVLRFSTSQDGSLCTPERFDVILGHQRLGVAFVGDGAELVPVVHRIIKQSSGNFNASSGECRPNIRLGDVLVAVNGVDAIALGVDKAMAMVTSASRPITLTIQRVSNETHFSETSCEAKSFSSNNSSDKNSQKILSRLHSRHLIRSMIDTELSSPKEIDIAFEFDNDKESVDLSRTMRASHSSYVDDSDDILIVWKHGPLGLTLQEDDISGLPIVNRLTGKGTSTGIGRVHHGYLLESVNGVKTDRESFAALCARLAKMQKPILLAFKPPNEHGVHYEDAESYTFSATSSSRSSSWSSSSSRLSSDSLDGNQPNHHRAAQQKSILDMCYAGKLRGKTHLGKNEYELRWHAGEELGLVLGKHPTQQLPYIRNIQSSSTLDFGGRDAVGDTLVAVNNLETHGLAWQEVRLLLQSATRPTMLRFHRHQRDSDAASSALSTDSELQTAKRSCPTSYNLLWATGHLGITFSSYVDSDNGNATVIVVKHVKQGHAKHTGLVVIGDRLVAINGKLVARNDESFYDTMDMLKMMSKPVVLGFQRPMVEVGDELHGVEVTGGLPLRS
uniref:PDZ domain-containing protein n=1 Tax=Globisporangium ultimum (strain ATCC 200006 / CBS 805.95 / DAOM BR144) TaxID=431595 RepID=K3WML0_GLOUD